MKYPTFYQITIVICLALWQYGSVLADPPTTIWMTQVGGDQKDEVLGGTRTADGGMVISGWTSSFGAWLCDGYLVKFNDDGDTVWTQMYNTPYYDYAWEVVETYDGGFALGGRHSLYSGGIRLAWLIRTDAGGDSLWAKNYQGTDDLETSEIVQLEDSTLVLIGYIGSNPDYDYFVLGVDTVGDSLYYTSWGGDENDRPTDAVATESGLVVVGFTTSYGGMEKAVYVIRLNMRGDTVWTRTFLEDTNMGSPNVVVAQNGNYIISTGFYDSSASMVATVLLEIDGQGDSVGAMAVPGPQSVTILDFSQTSDGGFLLTGSISMGYPDGGQAYVARTNASGDTLWTGHYGGTSTDQGRFVYENDAGEPIVGGIWAAGSYSDFFAFKLESSGCCVGESIGNMDGLPGWVDTGDLALMIDMLFISLNPIDCLVEADIDQSGGGSPLPIDIDTGDLMTLIDHLFISLGTLPACP